MNEMETKELTTTNQAIAPNPADLLQLAVEKGTDIDQLEKLMDLQERWEKKEAEKAFYQAMNEFQADKPVIHKNSSVDSVSRKSGIRINYSFASLPYIQRIVDPILSKYGLSYSWDQKEELVNGQSKFTIICVVKHVDGHNEKTELSGYSDTSGSKNAIQAIGSTVSYLKRYTLCNALGLSSDDDNDGQSGDKKPSSKQLTEKQWRGFQKQFKEGYPDLLAKTEKYYDLTDLQKDWIVDNRPTPNPDQWQAIQQAFEQGDTDMEAIDRSYKLNDEQDKWIKSKL